MMSSDQKKIVNSALKDCLDVQEMFTYLQNTFNLKECKPGTISKHLFISGIMKGIELINPKLK